MRKILLVLGLMTALLPTPVMAVKTDTKATPQPKGLSPSKNGPDRAPVRLPIIDVVYDSDGNSIEFISSTTTDASVIITDKTDNIIASADSLDEIIYLPESDVRTLYILIESDLWYATATISR